MPKNKGIAKGRTGPSQPKTKIFIEAIPLVSEKPSGISHALAGLVAAIVRNPAARQKYEVVLVAPKRGLHLLDRWPGLKECKRQGLPFRMRIMQGLMRVHLLPPMDVLLGKGIYLFGNYMNWPVTKRSTSFTYIHDVAFALHPQFVSPPLQRMLMAKVPGFIKQTDYVITVSESSRAEIQAQFGVADDRMLVLHNGVDTELFRPYGQKRIADVRKKYGIDKPYFLFVSNIEPRKNIVRMLQALQQLPPDQALVMVGGDGWLNDEVFREIDKARAADYSIIKPQTFVPDEDVAVLMSGAIALVHPALHEGFGMPPVEALATGVPVVVSDIPSLKEVAGKAGTYCDPMDVASIAQAMRQVLSLSPANRQAQAKRGILQARRFSWEDTATTFVAFLDSI